MFKPFKSFKPPPLFLPRDAGEDARSERPFGGAQGRLRAAVELLERL
jgi:hypothetical protein